MTEAGGKRVLITGVTGTLARQLTEDLLLDGSVDFIVGVDAGEEPYYFRDVDHSRFLYKNANVLKARELNNLFLEEDFKAARIDTVVHTLFVEPNERGLNLGTSPLSPNVQGTKLLLERCQEVDHIARFVQLSSHSVYHVRAGRGAYLDESADLNFEPGASRLIQDRVDADMLCRTQLEGRELDIAVLRPAPIIGRNINGALNHYLQSPFCPAPMGFDPIVNPIHSRDVVRALKLLVHSDATGVFNVAGKEVAPLSFFIRLAGGTRIPLPGASIPAASRLLRMIRASRFDAGDSGALLRHACLLDTEKARKTIGFEPTFHIKF